MAGFLFWIGFIVECIWFGVFLIVMFTDSWDANKTTHAVNFLSFQSIPLIIFIAAAVAKYVL